MSLTTLEAAPISIERVPKIGSNRAQEVTRILTDCILQWQYHPGYMNYLKEGRRTEDEIREYWKQELSTKKAELYLLTTETDSTKTVQDISSVIGYLLYHFHDENRDSLEVSFRTSPTAQHRGVCTSSTRETSDQLLSEGVIREVAGYHAAENDGSLKVFHRAGFDLTEYIPDGAYLTHPDKHVDVFGWRKSHNGLHIPESHTHHIIRSGAEKHNVPERLRVSRHELLAHLSHNQ